MAQFVQYATKQQLVAALDRGELVYARSSRPEEKSGTIQELLKTQETMQVTNRQKSFYASLSMGAKNKIKVM